MLIYFTSNLDSVKYYPASVHIRSYSGPQFPAFGLNTVQMRKNADQNNSEYGHFSRNETFTVINSMIRSVLIETLYKISFTIKC